MLAHLKTGLTMYYKQTNDNGDRNMIESDLVGRGMIVDVSGNSLCVDSPT